MNVYVVADEFTEFPGPRYRHLGPFSGEEFREDVLRKILDSQEKVALDFDGVIGFGSSFLEEAFGGLVRGGYSKENVLQLVDRIKSEEDPSLITEIRRYVEDASSKDEE